MKIFRSVKFRLTLSYALILTALLSVFAFYMYTELSRVLYRDTDRSLAYEAKNFETSMESYLSGIFRGAQLLTQYQQSQRLFSYPPELRLKLIEVIEDWEKTTQSVNRSLHLVRIVGIDQTVILSNLKGWEKEIIFPDFERDSIFMESEESFQTIHFQKRPIRLYYRLIRYSGRPLFILQCGTSIHELKSVLQRLLFLILISIPAAVGASCFAGWYLAKRSFRPVDSMIKKAREITAATLHGRLPRTYAEDELDRLTETLNEMIDRIESSTRAVQEFSSDVSHELKTPLAIIRGEIDLALRKTRSPEALVATLGVIGEEVNELIRLVDDLMLLVRSDAKQLRFEKKKVSLLEILRQIEARFKDRAMEKEIELSLEAHDEAWLQGDTVYLKRLFSNLFDNAIKFTPKGGKVLVRLNKGPHQIIVEVEDTGVGIPQDKQSKVFSRFYRTEQARSQEGAGLGLNIAKVISEAHSGSISIQGAPRQGTLLRVILPT